LSRESKVALASATTIDSRLGQPVKASLPIVDTVEEMFTDFKFLQ
jgi:hypothetical protein